MASSNISDILSIFDKVVEEGCVFQDEAYALKNHIEKEAIVFDCDDNHKWRAKIDYRIIPTIVKFANTDFVLRGIITELNKKEG